MAARGEAGTVAGLDPSDVKRILLAFHDESYGQEFSPRDAAGYFLSEHGVTEEQAEQLAQAYLRLDGVGSQGHGVWQAGPRVRPLIMWRDWRLATGQLDLAGARYLAEADLRGAPDTVGSLQERCRRSIRNLKEAEGAIYDDDE